MTFVVKTHAAPAQKTYCGPSVLMLLTGYSRDEVHKDINLYRRKIKTKGRDGKLISLTAKVGYISVWAMAHCLKKYGFNPKEKIADKETVRAFADNFSTVKKPIVIYIRGHFMLLHAGKLYDNHFRDGVDVDGHYWPGHRVKRYWVLDNVTAKSRKKPASAPDTPKGRTIDLDTEEAAPRVIKKKKTLQEIRYEKAVANAKKYALKEKRAKTAKKKWEAKVKRYEKIFAKPKVKLKRKIDLT